MEASVRKAQNYKIEVSRNFRGTPFTPLMTKEAKLQIERKVVEVLGDLYGSYTQIQKLSDEDCDWMRADLNIDPKTTSKEHDAAGINDDWPVGRGVFIQDNRDFIVLVNLEDHLKFVIMPDRKNPNDTLHEGIIRTIKILKTFEKLTYATDPYLGNLSVSPANLGTSMKLSCNVRLVDPDMSNPTISKKKISPELL